VQNPGGKLDALAVQSVGIRKMSRALLRQFVIAALRRIVDGFGHLEKVTQQAHRDRFLIDIRASLVMSSLLEHTGTMLELRRKTRGKEKQKLGSCLSFDY
jgi:hypothetical protein